MILFCINLFFIKKKKRSSFSSALVIQHNIYSNDQLYSLLILQNEKMQYRHNILGICVVYTYHIHTILIVLRCLRQFNGVDNKNEIHSQSARMSHFFTGPLT